MVQVNQEVIILEAMKMETSVASTMAGKVKQVLVALGEAVPANAPLIEFE